MKICAHLPAPAGWDKTPVVSLKNFFKNTALLAGFSFLPLIGEANINTSIIENENTAELNQDQAKFSFIPPDCYKPRFENFGKSEIGGYPVRMTITEALKAASKQQTTSTLDLFGVYFQALERNCESILCYQLNFNREKHFQISKPYLKIVTRRQSSSKGNIALTAEQKLSYLRQCMDLIKDLDKEQSIQSQLATGRFKLWYNNSEFVQAEKSPYPLFKESDLLANFLSAFYLRASTLIPNNDLPENHSLRWNDIYEFLEDAFNRGHLKTTPRTEFLKNFKDAMTASYKLKGTFCEMAGNELPITEPKNDPSQL